MKRVMDNHVKYSYVIISTKVLPDYYPTCVFLDICSKCTNPRVKSVCPPRFRPQQKHNNAKTSSTLIDFPALTSELSSHPDSDSVCWSFAHWSFLRVSVRGHLIFCVMLTIVLHLSILCHLCLINHGLWQCFLVCAFWELPLFWVGI